MTETSVQDQLLRAPDVLEATGVTYRQLDYWCRVGYISPSREAPSTHPKAVAARGHRATTGTGYYRWWDALEVEVVRRMVVLIQAGLVVEVAATAARSSERVDLGHGISLSAPWTAS